MRRAVGDAAMGLTVLLLAATCAKAPSAQTPAAPPGGTFVLAIGASQLVSNSDVTVKFEAVVEDSRCPTGTQCIWAGDASVKIQMSAPNAAPFTATLHTNLDSARSTTYRGLRIRIEAVTPAPSATAKPAPKDYRLTLSVAGDKD